MPSYKPTVSSFPTNCHSVKIAILTTGATYEDIAGVTSWELYEQSTKQEVLSGGSFNDNTVEEYTTTTDDCLEEGNYIFSITNSNGVGFGEDCLTCGYFVFVNDVSIGGNINFFYEDRLTFPLPLLAEAGINDGGDDTASLCSGDFFLRIETDNNPEEITWILVNVKGETVLSGE